MPGSEFRTPRLARQTTNTSSPMRTEPGEFVPGTNRSPITSCGRLPGRDIFLPAADDDILNYTQQVSVQPGCPGLRWASRTPLQGRGMQDIWARRVIRRQACRDRYYGPPSASQIRPPALLVVTSARDTDPLRHSVRAPPARLEAAAYVNSSRATRRIPFRTTSAACETDPVVDACLPQPSTPRPRARELTVEPFSAVSRAIRTGGRA